jgi:hypothetical protein
LYLQVIDSSIRAESGNAGAPFPTDKPAYKIPTQIYEHLGIHPHVSVIYLLMCVDGDSNFPQTCNGASLSPLKSSRKEGMKISVIFLPCLLSSPFYGPFANLINRKDTANLIKNSLQGCSLQLFVWLPNSALYFNGIDQF